MTIELSLILGFVAGLIVGGAVAKTQIGCLILLAIPVTMVAYLIWWQGENPDKLTSTSGLDFLFGPLWPSLGAIGGFSIAKLFRLISDKR